MLQFMKRVPFVIRFLLLAIMISMVLTMGEWMVRPLACSAKQIGVELVWNYGQAGWVEISVLEGSYTLVVGDEQNGRMGEGIVQEAGSKMQLGWGGWAPVWRLNEEEFNVFRYSKVEIWPESLTGSSFQVRTPEGRTARYRGGLVMSWEGDHWKLINYLEDEDYLKGVVPIEMSNAWAPQGLEALKAQAVAARTYLVKHTAESPVITDSPNIHQAYLGKSVEGAASQAVEQTRNEILVDRASREPITAFYSAHNGGYTEDAQNVWKNRDEHYSAHPDPFTKGSGGFLDDWYFIVSAPALGEKFGLGPVRKLELDKWASGRVKKVSMEDWNGKQKSVTGRELVRAFYPYERQLSADSFLGSLFTVAYYPTGDPQDGWGFAADFPFGSWRNYLELPGPRLGRVISSHGGLTAYNQPYGVYVFAGSGWGHGVGMSQWGAYEMAKLGYTYDEILAFYYDNVLLVEGD